MTEYITVKEFANKTDYTVAYILQLIQKGEITKYVRPTPRKTKIHVDELKKFILEY